MAAAALAAWVVVEHGAPELLHVDDLVRESWGALAALLLLVGAVLAVARLRPEGLLLLPFALFRLRPAHEMGRPARRCSRIGPA